MGKWVASGVSLRYTLPGAITLSGGATVCMVRIWTGEVCVRSRHDPPPMKKVSCASRAGWSGGKFRAPKLKKSVSISGPSAMT